MKPEEALQKKYLDNLVFHETLFQLRMVEN